MKVSLAWLRELVEIPLDADELARRLTMAGLEVEGRARFGAFTGVIAAEVRGKRPHPDAAKLTLVDVFDGREVTQVVCGAPNVPEPGAIVLWARPGAKLPDGRVLEAKAVRGVVSPGMLCAEDELGIGESHAGILVLAPGELQPGDDVAQKLGLPDEIFELNVTPNRPDCLGHLGVAREIAALTGAPLHPIAVTLDEPKSGNAPRVELEDAAGCPRYTALALDGIQTRPSPLAVRWRLVSLGVRAISNVVDATNWVLLEYGQPLHAFDLDKLARETIVVRRARAGEKMHTLDGQERTLAADDVAICDAEKPVAIAGVMGGATSEVSATTKRVLLESAYFAPSNVRRTAKRLGLHTEASHRFERGVDPEGAPEASRRCAQLMVAWAGARVTAPMTDAYPKRLEPAKVTLRAQRTRALLGVEVSAERQEQLLVALGLEVQRAGESIHTLIPTRRPDLTREIDLIEEIARLHGYDQVPATIPPLRSAPGRSGDPVRVRAADALSGLGFDEIVTYAFIAPAANATIDPASQPLRLANPIREEQSAMRTTLAPGLLAALGRNLQRGVEDVKLFEIGEVYLPTGQQLPDERRRVAGLLAGRSDGWLKRGASFDFFDAKGAVEALMAALGRTAQFLPSKVAWLHPGVQASIAVDGKLIGVCGEVHPSVLPHFGVEARAFVFELELAPLAGAPLPTVVEPPRYPHVVRDLSFFVAAERSASELSSIFDEIKDPLCVSIDVLEDYREAGRVPAGHKGMLWSFTYRAADRTLTDAEVQSAHERLLARLKERLPVTQR